MEKRDSIHKDPQERKKKRSVVWKHFNVVNVENTTSEFAHCKYCQAKYKCTENGKNLGTSNLMDHLKEKHHELKLNSKDEKTTEFVFSQDKYRAALLKWIVECDQPFTSPQHAAFLKVVETLNPTAKVVSSATLKRDLMKKFAEEFEQVKSTVSDIPGKISFTMDGWTSKNIFPFVNIRAHWIDAQWESQSVLLEFAEIHNEHSGDNLCKIFLKCLERYRISVSKILAITLDNASNNDTFVASFINELSVQGVNISIDDIHVRCLAHVMNLSVQDILSTLGSTNYINEKKEDNDGDEDMEEDDQSNKDDHEQDSKPSKSIVAKLREPIKKIRKSPQMRQAFNETCTTFGIKYKVPIIDVKNRWNSSYRMIERAIELREPFDDFCTQLLPSHTIDSNDWHDLVTINDLLKKFDRATKFISMDRHTTISAYLPTIYWLIDSLEAFIQKNSGPVIAAVKCGVTKLKKYEALMNSSKISLIALFLNPALKLAYFKEHNFTKVSIKGVEKMIEKVFEDSYACTNVSKEGVDDDLLAHMLKRPKKETNLTEFRKYMSYPLSSPQVDLLAYWKAQEKEFPFLTNMARDYLAAQSSSVPVERDFSGGVDLVTPTRCSLKPETIRACMCLKSWFSRKI